MSTVLVSGGASTLGRAICRRFCQAGATVYAGYASSVAQAQALQEQLGPALIPIHLDVQDQTSIDSFIDRLGSLDVLVNNSGVFSVYETQDLATEEWERIFSINVTGMFNLTKAALKLLVASGGSIVNIASINAFHPGFGGTTAYDAAKGAVVSYTRSLAAEVAPRVRVNAVAPGLIAAPYLGSENPIRKRYEERSLLRRMVEPDEVAQVVEMLSLCTAITAEVVTVDCGYLMG